MPPPTTRHWFGGLGAFVATVALGMAAGPWGLVAGLGAMLAWAVLPAAYAFAVAQLLAVTTLTTDAPLAMIVLAEAGLLAVLAGPLTTTDAPVRAVGVLVVASVTLTAVGLGLHSTDGPLWLAALVVAAVAVTAGYGLHRYERLRLGLLEEAT